MTSTLSEEGLLKLETPALLQLWNGTLNQEDREPLLRTLQKGGLYPAELMRQWDRSVGAYPDYDDPEFLQRLLAKKEFAESFQTTWNPVNDPCAADTKFEITPVQRFAANLLSPRTPYMSALLYHGVGVGKTCSAIQISEAWLGEFPQEQVYIIAPPTIQEGFRTTIFDTDSRRLTLGTGSEQNQAFGCTGNTYMELTGTLMDRDIKRIQLRVGRAINRRYRFFGYIQFANYVKSLISEFARIADPDQRRDAERKKIRDEFSNKLLIIDEAHNLREVLRAASSKKEEEEENADEPNGRDGADDMKAGKEMTPWLIKVLDYSYGMKLVLMTATPMYNSHLEIIFMINLMLLNDKKALITQDMIFEKNGDLKEGADRILGAYASRYISFMRGENPRSFPIRLKPHSNKRPLTQADYPELTMKRRLIAAKETVFVNYLPLVRIELPVESENYKASKEFLDEFLVNTDAIERGISSQDLGLSVQAGNFVVPGTTPYKVRMQAGLLGVFDKQTSPRIMYRAKAGTDTKWLLKENLINYSPKFVYLLDQLATCDGVAFVYSRFINSGALPLALALEANGYKCYARETGFLVGGAPDGLGGQCALCPRRQKNHEEGWAGIDEHPFKQAYYGLLTGEKPLTPDRNIIIKGEQKLENKEGALLKVVIGSQIASEGVDLRYVREVHILDSWYHLNKTEQVIGRAIRFCSHSALPEQKRNTTIYLYAAYMGKEQETADLYSYRLAFRKAKQVGQVSRALKAYAIDCNLNHAAIIIQGQPTVRQVDSQRVMQRKVNINDVGFTAICDWLELCDYKCTPQIDKKDMGTDDTTYSEFAVRWREGKLRERMRAIFQRDVIVELANMEAEFSDVPIIARNDFLMSVIDNKQFQVVHNNMTGYIRFCNNYFVFQPFIYGDINIPLAIRMGSFPVRRDFFNPTVMELQDTSLVEEEASLETTELGTVWTTIQEWATALSKSTTWTEPPKTIYDHINFLAKEDRKKTDYLRLILMMIQWVHISLNKNLEKHDMEAFRKITLEFLWDNWFSVGEQKTLHDSEMLKDATYTDSSITIFRFYDTTSDRIMYELDGKEALPAVRSAIQEDEKKAEKDFKTKKEPLTGTPYGFLIGKQGTLVFKTNQLPSGGKLTPGKECGNDTKVGPKHIVLEQLGVILVSKGQPDMDLRPDMIGHKRQLSAAGSCIIMELVLRYMDAIRLDGRRWFYRPVNAKILGHNGQPSVAYVPETKVPVVPKEEVKVPPKEEVKVPVVPTKEVKKALEPKPKPSIFSLDNEGEFVAPVSLSPVKKRYTLAELKGLTRLQLKDLTVNQYPTTVTTGQLQQIYDNAKTNTNIILEAPIIQAPAPKVTIPTVYTFPNDKTKVYDEESAAAALEGKTLAQYRKDQWSKEATDTGTSLEDIIQAKLKAYYKRLDESPFLYAYLSTDDDKAETSEAAAAGKTLAQYRKEKWIREAAETKQSLEEIIRAKKEEADGRNPMLQLE